MFSVLSTPIKIYKYKEVDSYKESPLFFGY